MSTPRLGDRSLFPDLRPACYLNHAAVHPVSAPVRAAVLGAMSEGERDGMVAVLAWMETVEATRRAVARLLEARAQDVALVANTSAGITAVATSFPWKRGDRVVLFEDEFPANVIPWLHASKRFGLEVETIPIAGFAGDASVGLDALDAVLRRGVRMVAVSAVQFQTGLRMPWQTIAQRAKASGAVTFVDAIQAAGIVPIDVSVSDADFLSAGSHKWLGGTPGAGVLWARPERWAELAPDRASWLSTEEPIDFLFAPGLMRYDKPLRVGPPSMEGGMVNALPMAALGASVGLLEQLGVRAVFAHVGRYLDALEPRIAALGFRSLRDPHPDRRSGILSFRPPVPAARLVEALADAGVSASTPDGTLRFAPHWPNALDEVDRVVMALERAVGRVHGGPK